MSALPTILSETRAGNVLTLQLAMDHSLEVFKGHFEQLPIVPGIAQVDWALRFGHAHLGLPLHSRQLLNLKFLRVIRSGTEVWLELAPDVLPHAAKLVFRFSDALGTYSQGTVVFAP